MRISDWSSDVCSSDLEVLVVLVERPADAVVRQPEVLDVGGPVALGGVLEGLVRRHVDAFQHRSQHGAGMQVVLVRVDTDGELAAVLRGLIDADAGAAGGRIDDIAAPVELALGTSEDRRVGKEGVRTYRS